MCTDDLQFAFKAKVGCRNAISVLSSSVDYYTRLGSTVNVAALDMSKAFDKLNHAGLWLKLLKRNIPRCFVSVLADWYSKVFICVKWGSSLSEMFKIAAGVRQGGVLSPVLFAVYVHVDDVIVNLKSSGFGCYFAGEYIGVLLYADDLLLISITVTDLREMLQI